MRAEEATVQAEFVLYFENVRTRSLIISKGTMQLYPTVVPFMCKESM